MFEQLIKFIRDTYNTKNSIPLHAPIFPGNEMAYLADTITSTFVSSVGPFVDRFEKEMSCLTGAEDAVAVVNGTAALHLALLTAGVRNNDLVLTQPLSFVATCNAIAYCGAAPVFIDVDLSRMSLSPGATEIWLNENACLDLKGNCRHKISGRIIKAMLPVHTFGHPAALCALKRLCIDWNLTLIEDAAEAVGSTYRGKHTGTFGDFGAISFNGNKIITTGGGGMVLTDRENSKKIKHISTTAKIPHPFKYEHDMLAYNYRMPSLNAALGCAQLEKLGQFIRSKRTLAKKYSAFFSDQSFQFVTEPGDSKSNYWLNALICADRSERDALIHETNAQNIVTRPIWGLLHKQPMYTDSIRGPLDNAEWLADRIVNLPSGVQENSIKTI